MQNIWFSVFRAEADTTLVFPSSVILSPGLSLINNSHCSVRDKVIFLYTETNATHTQHVVASLDFPKESEVNHYSFFIIILSSFSILPILCVSFVSVLDFIQPNVFLVIIL